jgi:hypothetical protein
MADARTVPGKTANWVRLAARFLSLATSGVFLLITYLAVTSEDGLKAPAIWVLALLALTILACLAAWRWEKVGGILVVVGAIGLGISATYSSSAFGLGAFAFLASLIYGLPFLLVGVLFLLSDRMARNAEAS